MTTRTDEYIRQARYHAKAIWDALNALEGMQKEWNALDYGNTMQDGSGDNEGYTSQEVGAVVFATADAMRALLNTGHATNLAKLL